MIHPERKPRGTRLSQYEPDGGSLWSPRFGRIRPDHGAVGRARLKSSCRWAPHGGRRAFVQLSRGCLVMGPIEVLGQGC